MIDDRLEGDSLLPEEESLSARRRGAANRSSSPASGEDAIAALFAAAEVDGAADHDSADSEPDERASDDGDGEAGGRGEDRSPGAAGRAERGAGERPDPQTAIDALFGAASQAGLGARDAVASDGEDVDGGESDPWAHEERDGASSSEAGEPTERYREEAVEDDATGSDEAADEAGSLLQMSPDELRHAVEAVLFAVGEPVTVRALGELFGVSGPEVREAIEVLKDEYVESGRAFRLEEIAGGVQILTLPAHNAWIRKLRQKQREGRLSAAALETLAVIAYKQPITKADLENIRGVQCGPTLKTLIDRGLIQVVGKDESLGRPLLYGTTRRFLESFGLSSLRELPQPEVLPRVPGEGPPIGIFPPPRPAEPRSGEDSPSERPVSHGDESDLDDSAGLSGG